MSFSTVSSQLLLASGSAVRRSMLENAGVTFGVEPAKIDEAREKEGFEGSTDELAIFLATAKATNVSEKRPDALVIGSDSIVECKGRRFDKPQNRSEAAEHLRLFSATKLRLSSAVVLAQAGRVEWSAVESALLHVRPLSKAFIEDYLTAEWPEVGACVGVFRMEGRGATLFERVEGSHFTILGMPLLPLLGALRERGMLPS